MARAASGLKLGLALLRDTADGAPLIKSASGLAVLIAEFSTCNFHEEIQRLAQYVQDVMTTFLSGITREHKLGLPPEFCSHLATLQLTLEEILDFLNAASARTPKERAKGRAALAVAAQQLHTRLNQALALFNFKNHLMGRLELEETQALEEKRRIVIVSTLAQDEAALGTSVSASLASCLPPRPQIIFGRDEPIGHIVSTVLDGNERARIAILGAAGIGKSTVALAVLHHPRIAASFGTQRLFIPCDSTTSADGLIATLAARLDIAGTKLRQRVLSALGAVRTLLILDNFESPWEGAAVRAEVEGLLGSLAAMEMLTVVIALRGTERPLGIRWTQPMLRPLQPVSATSALQVFCAVSGIAEPLSEESEVHELLARLDGVPLAIFLMANLAQYEPIRWLMARWDAEGTSILDRGIDHRLSSVDASIRLSLTSPRFTSTPHALEVLSLLSLFPDGISNDVDDLDFLTRFSMPRRILSTLRQVALAYDTSGEANPRAGHLRVLAPIREYMLRHYPLDLDALSPVKAFYDRLLQLTSKLGTSETPVFLARLGPEAGNIAYFINYVLHRDETGTWAIDATIDFARYSDYAGLSASSLLHSAVAVAERMSRLDLQIDLLLYLAKETSNVSERLRVGEAAISMARLAQDVPREIEALLVSGRALQGAVMADEYLERAVRLSEASGNRRLHAQCLLGCGVLNTLYRDSPAAALPLLKRALSLFFEVGSTSNMAWCNFRLGDAYSRLDKLEMADDLYRTALVQAREVADTLVEAHTLVGMGNNAGYRSELGKAMELFQASASLYKQINETGAWALVTSSVGQMALHLGDYVSARQALEVALSIQIQTSDMPGVAQSNSLLGDLAYLQDEFEEAVARYTRALSFYRSQVGSQLLFAFTVSRLGEVARKQINFDSAFVYFTSALAAYRKFGRQLELGRCATEMGQLLVLTGDLASAVCFFQIGRHIARRLKLYRDIAEALKGMGEVWLRRQVSVADTRSYFAEASELFARTKDELEAERCSQKLQALMGESLASNDHT